MITNKDNFILSLIVETGNFFKFQGEEWENQIKCFSLLAGGNPEKCQKLLELLADVDPLGDRISRKIYNTYLELMLFMADKCNCPEERNT